MLIRRLVCDFLIKEGHTPLEAADGKMAVELFNRNPDTALIIMDIMMPELDGWEATREIRRHSAVPIMLLSARSQDFDQLTGFESGADDYVTKPFSPAVLMKRVETNPLRERICLRHRRALGAVGKQRRARGQGLRRSRFADAQGVQYSNKAARLCGQSLLTRTAA